MKKLFLSTLLAVVVFSTLSTTAIAQYNNWSIGFRLGEPSGINVRKYFGTNHAFDLNIGTYGGLYGTQRNYRNGEYRTVGLSIQGHYLWHAALTKSESIRGYYGFGGQINTRKFYNAGGVQSQLSLGGSGIAGLEFFPVGKPYSFFLETGAYVELLQSPFFLSLNTGLGLRYNF